jgi:3-oxoacyl-(acyl-carrier-protein) synthase
MGIASTPSAIAQGLGINARTMSISTQCTSGMSAIAHAAEMVGRGEADIAICGGTEAPLSRFPLLELKVVELTPASDEMPALMARPFDLWRSTGVVAEGAAIVVLEPESSPRPGYSFIAGHGFDGDERDQLCGGMEEAARQAMAEARIRPNHLDVLSAWGPGHRTIDLGEFEALSRLMPGILREIPAFSLKGAMGIPLGAAPAIQLAAASLGQAHGMIPPTVNWQYPDPSCPFNLSREVRNIPHEWTLVTAHGAGGTNSAMLLQRC